MYESRAPHFNCFAVTHVDLFLDQRVCHGGVELLGGFQWLRRAHRYPVEEGTRCPVQDDRWGEHDMAGWHRLLQAFDLVALYQSLPHFSADPHSCLGGE